MSIKTLIIFNSPILFEILEEIKENLHFEIVAATEDEISQNNFRKSNDHVIVSCQANNIKECKIINTPIRLDRILEQINTFFLGNKFSSQSKIKIRSYFLNLNSRIISKNETELDLTEKEIELILFVMKNKFVSLEDLQKKVWNYSPDLETHTVETHIYRLRKKFSERFKDDEFIGHDKRGYYLN